MANPQTQPNNYTSAGPGNASSGTITIPTIPTATDLPSALVALNVIAQAIAVIAQNIAASAAATGSTTSSATGGTFVQTDQVTETVTLTDPNDSTVSVQVEQITSLTLRNPVTGEEWIWNQA
jgi:hypothetical protein